MLSADGAAGCLRLVSAQHPPPSRRSTPSRVFPAADIVVTESLDPMTKSNAPSSSKSTFARVSAPPSPHRHGVSIKAPRTPSRGRQHWNPRGCLWRCGSWPSRRSRAGCRRWHTEVTPRACRVGDARTCLTGHPSWSFETAYPAATRESVGAAAPIGLKLPGSATHSEIAPKSPLLRLVATPTALTADVAAAFGTAPAAAPGVGSPHPERTIAVAATVLTANTFASGLLACGAVLPILTATPMLSAHFAPFPPRLIPAWCRWLGSTLTVSRRPLQLRKQSLEGGIDERDGRFRSDPVTTSEPCHRDRGADRAGAGLRSMHRDSRGAGLHRPRLSVPHALPVHPTPSRPRSVRSSSRSAWSASSGSRAR